MPIRITYDLTGATSLQANRVQSIFERFRWESSGGSAYHYPASGPGVQEDWLNHVVPALMCFRAYVLKENMRLSRFTIDTVSGHLPLLSNPRSGDQINIAGNQQASFAFGREHLIRWIDAVTNAIPY
jgi:hypothetical protein